MNNIERLVQVGTVTAVDTTNNKARVKFRDVDMTSDWLYVLQRPGTRIFLGSEVTSEGEASADVTVNGTAEMWLPKINDTVVVLYLPIFNSDGFILGAI